MKVEEDEFNYKIKGILKYLIPSGRSEKREERREKMRKEVNQIPM